MGRYGERMERFYRSLEPLKVLKPVRKHICGQAAVYDWDCSKIVISTREAPGLDGPGLGDILRQQYHLEMEMCAPEYLVAMTSLMDTEKGLKRLSRALLEIDAGLAEKQFRLEHQMAETKEDARDLIENRKGEDDEKAFKPDSAMTISEAAALPGVSVPLTNYRRAYRESENIPTGRFPCPRALRPDTYHNNNSCTKKGEYGKMSA